MNLYDIIEYVRQLKKDLLKTIIEHNLEFKH